MWIAPEMALPSRGFRVSRQLPRSSRSAGTGMRWGICVIGLVFVLGTGAMSQQPAAEADSVARRLELATRPLLGVEYVLSPLGEGRPPDGDPRWRLDAFDCTTFVETALVLARDVGDGMAPTEQPAQARQVSLLDRLRYAGPPAFENRRHLMAAQWLPDLAELAQIEDITSEVGGVATRVASLSLDQARWDSRRVARSLVLPPDKVPEGEFALEYVPLEELEERFSLIPMGTLINVVREPVPWAPILVSHQALVLEKPLRGADATGGNESLVVVRHASAALGRVADQTPAQFLSRLKQPRARPVVGVNLWRVTLAELAPLPGSDETSRP